MSGFDDRLEDEDYDLIAENTGLQLQRKKFRRIHGNVLDSDEEEEEGVGPLHPEPPSGESPGRGVSTVREESRDSSMQDEDFVHVSLWHEWASSDYHYIIVLGVIVLPIRCVLRAWLYYITIRTGARAKYFHIQ